MRPPGGILGGVPLASPASDAPAEAAPSPFEGDRPARPAARGGASRGAGTLNDLSVPASSSPGVWGGGVRGRWAAARPGLRSGLLSLGVIGTSGLALGGLYAGAGIGIPCPLRLVTGWDCPLCGGTRMAAALLHGDLGAAFVYNPLALVGLIVAVVLGVAWLVELFGGPRLQLPGRLARGVTRIPRWSWWGAGLFVAVGYMLLRNLAWPIPA